MASTVLLKIGNTNVSDNIVADSYSVYNQPVYKVYEDANGVTHKRFIRDKIEGSFEMFFRTMRGYTDFVDLINTNTSSSDFSVLCTVYDTKRSDVYTINAFIEFEPTIALDGTLNEYMKVLKIKLEER